MDKFPDNRHNYCLNEKGVYLDGKFRAELKSQRISGGVPQDHAITYAFLKHLRNYNKTKIIYELNPYIEVYQFRDNLYGLLTHNCDAAGDVWMYLIIGPEKAMLIDTSFGLGDTKALVDELTGGKPLIVVNTHSHFDHAYGNCRFDRVYCHEYTAPLLEQQTEHIWDYLFDENGKNIWLEFDRNDLPIFRPYEIVGVPDGYVFDLGNDYCVELKWVPGHASGHAMYIDKVNRILFAGDGLCCHWSSVGGGIRTGDPHGQYNNLYSYTRELTQLENRLDEFDYIFPSHFMNDLPNTLINQILQACNLILENPESYDFSKTHASPNGGPPVTRLFKSIYGFGELSFSANGIYPPTI
jgi:glyoxylase-like metal-dependent hydrolase (beta-lactamase superfamily II)